MLNSVLIVAAFNLDTFCLGLAIGASNKGVKISSALIFALIALALFLAPIFCSKYLASFFSVQFCEILIILAFVFLSLYYFITFIYSQHCKKRQKEGYYGEICDINKSLHIKKTKTPPMALKTLLINLLPINLDTIFTNLLIGFSFFNVTILALIFFTLCFLALKGGNALSLKLVSKTNINLGWVSGLIFLVFAIVKIIKLIK